MTIIPYTWRFFRAGGLDQVKLETGADLVALAQLDLKLWVALSCPTKGLEFDERTLALLDGDKDGRIRAGEITGAIAWAAARLRSSDELIKGGETLDLASLNDTSAEGRSLLASAKQILRNLGKPEATQITVAEATDTVRIFTDTAFNGDGIVPAATAKDPAVRAAIDEISKRIGTAIDRSGKAGITQAHADAFFSECTALATWWQAGEAAGLQLLTSDTGAAFAAFTAVRLKIDDWFVRCGLAAFDPRAAAHLIRSDAEYAVLSAKQLAGSAEVEALPLSRPTPGQPLDLSTGLNPAWKARIAIFRERVLGPLLGADKKSLSEGDWDRLAAAFANYEAWHATKAGAKVEDLGIARVRELLQLKPAVDELIRHDLSVQSEVSAIEDVERLIRYRRDLHRLTLNFVNFAHFYSRKQPAIFLAGTLFLDQRSCDLCIQVTDPGAHAVLGGMGKIYIAYCQCMRPSGEKIQIAAAFTQGDSDYLMVGRNGVFYDRKGRDWDATIIKVVDNPISIRQAFWSPYKKFVRLVEEQAIKRAAAAEATSQQKLASGAEAAANADKLAAEAAKSKEPPKKFDLAIITGIGVAIGSIGAFLATVFAKFIELRFWQIPLVIIGVMLAISLPSMILAWLKLRQRTLGPLLEGNGWAINGRITINIPLGSAFTATKRLPPGAQRSLADPFAEKQFPWRALVMAMVGLALIAGVTYWCYVRPWLTEREAQQLAAEAGEAPTPSTP